MGLQVQELTQIVWHSPAAQVLGSELNEKVAYRHTLSSRPWMIALGLGNCILNCDDSSADYIKIN